MLLEKFPWATPEEFDRITREAIREELLRALLPAIEEQAASVPAAVSRCPRCGPRGRKEWPRGGLTQKKPKGGKLGAVPADRGRGRKRPREHSRASLQPASAFRAGAGCAFDVRD